jgi:hypothetical protein
MINRKKEGNYQGSAQRAGVYNDYILIERTDGPALTHLQETRIRKKHNVVLVNEKMGVRPAATSSSDTCGTTRRRPWRRSGALIFEFFYY